MAVDTDGGYVSRGGQKLAAALDTFDVSVEGLICADLGSHIGGFVDCLLRRGACRVYSIDTSYGTLAWRLRRDDRVVVHERTNAIHVTLAEPVDFITVDVGWTPQRIILANVSRLLRPGGRVVSLVKPHYEAEKNRLIGGVLPDEDVEDVVESVIDVMRSDGWSVLGRCPSPIRGHGGNREELVLLNRQ